jgi:hypothetical protein
MSESLSGEPNQKDQYRYDLDVALSLFVNPIVDDPDYNEMLEAADGFNVNPGDPRPIEDQALEYTMRASDNPLNFASAMVLRSEVNRHVSDFYKLDDPGRRRFITAAAKETVGSLLVGKIDNENPVGEFSRIKGLVDKINRTHDQEPLPPPKLG